MMKVGFVSGSKVELTQDSHVPNWPVQGLLMQQLLINEDISVVLGSVASTHPEPTLLSEMWWDSTRFTYAPDEVDELSTCDVIWVERTAHTKVFNEKTGIQEPLIARVLKDIDPSIPLIYHAYVAYPGWAPRFQDWGLTDRRWTIVGRASNVEDQYRMSYSKAEMPVHGMDITYERWEPFWHNLYWPMELDDYPRKYIAGFVGRLPLSEERTHRIMNLLGMFDGPIGIGCPTAGVDAIPKKSNFEWLGWVPQSELSANLGSMAMTVFSPNDRLEGLDNWPNRIIEAGMCDTLTLFDDGHHLVDFGDRWNIKSKASVRHFQDMCRDDPEEFFSEVTAQLDIITPRANALKIHQSLVNILRKAVQG